jgi:phenylalanyl-tRNA synthetase beta chain
VKLTESMLRDYVQTPLSAEEVGDLLTMTGFELEEIATVRGEKVLDVNVMANRGDGASVLGLAREVLAKHAASRKTGLYERAEVRFYTSDQMDGECGSKAAVEVQTPNCFRYACRVFEGVKNGASPEWLRDRLEKLGQRPISLLVDLTNYVMFETGQPLHAFDLDKLQGQRIVVRQARSDEKSFTTLDGQERAITPDDMMICDAARPVAVAGVMGGLETEVSEGTSRMLLESASFSHTSVRNTRTRLGLHTEASYRFERWVDPEQAVAALNRFAELYEQATGERPVRGVVDVYPSPPDRKPIIVRMSRVKAVLGVRVDIGDAETYLRKLGFATEQIDGSLACTAPTWRIDIEREDDVVEEIGRIHGYELIPEELPKGETTRGGVFGADARSDEAREDVLRCGFSQTVSHSLCDLHPLDAAGERIRVRNPHSPEIAHLRNSNLPSVALAANRNGNQNLRLFEVGKVFKPGYEHFDLSLLAVGGDAQEDWQKKSGATADFFSMKGVVEYVCRHVDASVCDPAAPDRRLHPTRQAAVVLGGRQVGAFGQIHPFVAESCGLPAETVLAELDLTAICAAPVVERHLREVSRNPATRRDVAVAIDKSVPFAQIESAISEACGEVLERQWLFDVYEGKGIPKGQHSLAIALQLRKLGSNFTDEEANQVRDRAVQALEALGAKLR